MRTIYLSLVCLLVVACGEGKKNKPSDNAPVASVRDRADIAKVKRADTAASTKETVSIDPIAGIKQRVERINAIPLEKKHFEFMCDEKMMVDYFYHEGKIVKISVDYGTVGDVYAKEDYYFNEFSCMNLWKVARPAKVA
jgi:hypothetical protein